MPTLYRKVIIALGTACWVFAVYSQAFNSPFQFDDISFIVNNPAIRDVFDFRAIWNALETPTRFISFVTFALNFHFHQYDVVGYHIINCFIHLINGLLVFHLAKSLLALDSAQIAQAKKESGLIAFLAALVFLLHPGQTQAVVYITQRFELLAATFYLCVVYFYIKGRMCPERKESVLNFIVSFVFAFLAVFTKEIVVTMPLMIVCVELLFFQQKRGLRQVPWKIVAVFSALVFVIPFVFSFRLKSIFFSLIPSESHDGDVISLWPYFLTQMRVALTFLRLLIFPAGQNLDYDYPLSYSLADWRVVFCMAAIAGLIVFAWKQRRTNIFLAFGIFWFFIIFSANMVPRSNVIFEHKLYLMSVGLIIAGAFYSSRWMRHKDKFVMGAFGFVLILSFATSSRIQVWSSQLNLWKDTVKKSPGKSRPNVNLGRAFFDVGDYTKALYYYNRALELDPKNHKAYSNRGILYFKTGNPTLALADYNAALAVKANYFEAMINRANYYISVKQYDLAMADFQFILSNNPGFAMAYVNRGSLLARQKLYHLAINDFNEAEKLYVETPELFTNRGNAYRFVGQYDLAFKDYEKAIRLNPHSPLAYKFRSEMYAQLKQYDSAWKDAVIAKKLGARINDDYFRGLEKMITIK